MTKLSIEPTLQTSSDVEKPVKGLLYKSFDFEKNLSESGKLRESKQTGNLSEGIMMTSVPKVPSLVRQFMAELLGTFLVVYLGDGAIAQVVVGSQTSQAFFFSNFLSIALGYGFALTIGIFVSGGVSGGHLNPAVTLAMASIKKCKWKCVPVYMLAQYIGAFFASAILFGVYRDGIMLVEGGYNKTVKTQGIFASYPSPDINASIASLSFDQILATALLIIIILAVTDGKNMKVISSLVPLSIGLGLTAIHLSFGVNAGTAINPARDFSPRLFTIIAGYGNEPLTTGNYFFWIPWILPHVGALLGAFIYEYMIELHHPIDE
ncbi:aquaporin-9 isoform X2 [Lepeophtheirus salmonis]|uniref:aquaporin-9 isoform X2 n=1 Tax=Lepeophtheirus salmonis TaxID=72036 RepID=UPI001AEA398C|nr:aquaporin-9-like isoform X2 [Lepeophtheirus salmonis]